MHRGKLAATVWRAPPADPRLGDEEAHVWRLSLDEASASGLERLEDLLSPAERERARRFRVPADRDRFVLGRGGLRAILGRYTGVEPRTLEFDTGAHGKPGLVGPGSDSGVAFNLSHSDGWALLAFARDRRIGVDVERIREVSDGQIARRFFAPGETAALEASPPEERPSAFFACWTRKEAVAKALGRGLSLPLDDFEVSVRPDEPARLIACGAEMGDPSAWFLRSFDVGGGYEAAIAIVGPAAATTPRHAPGDSGRAADEGAHEEGFGIRFFHATPTDLI